MQLRLAPATPETITRHGQLDLGRGVGVVASADVSGARNPQYGLPLTAFVLLTIEYSILMTWVFLHTLGSVLIATLFHGAINLSQGLFLGGLDGATRYWLLSIVYGVAAIIVAVMLGLRARRGLTEPDRKQVREPTTS